LERSSLFARLFLSSVHISKSEKKIDFSSFNKGEVVTFYFHVMKRKKMRTRKVSDGAEKGRK
jgi:hypothetical protein